MTTPDPAGPGREEPGPVASIVRLFLGQLVAVIAIAAAITVVVTMLDPDGSDLRTASPGASPDGGAVGAATSPPPDSSPPASSPPASSPPASSPPASSPPASPSSATPPVPGQTGPQDRLPKVDVLNQSAPGGSAAVTARRLRDEGWRVGRVDDFSGNVSTTTVYWLDRGDRKAARRLARDLGGVRVQPGFSTLVDGRLSVVLVD